MREFALPPRASVCGLRGAERYEWGLRSSAGQIWEWKRSVDRTGRYTHSSGYCRPRVLSCSASSSCFRDLCFRLPGALDPRCAPHFSAFGVYGSPTFCNWGGTGFFVFFSSYWFGILRLFLRIPHLHLGDRRGNFVLGDSARACDTQIPLMELVVLARPICFLPRSSQNIVICTFTHHSHACTTFMCMCILFVRTHAHLCMCVHVCIMCACAFSKWRRTLATTAGSAGSTQGGC